MNNQIPLQLKCNKCGNVRTINLELDVLIKLLENIKELNEMLNKDD